MPGDSNMWENHKFTIMALVALTVVALSTLVIVPETHQGVKIRAGNPVYTINRFDPSQRYGETGAGIWYRIPIWERIQMVDRRILDLDMEREQVLANDQQRLEVDAYARFRIIDPVLMVESAGDEDRLRNQLEPILRSVLRQELGRRTFADLLSDARTTAMSNITAQLDRSARQYGAQVLDVRIKRADLPEGTPLAAAFNRMRSDREEEAETIRAGGRRDAQIIRAEAEANAARIYADAYGKDPGFYDFYRAMQSYRRTFETGEGESAIILSPDNEYLRQFRGNR
ncbi:protease modulator HflC [Alteraurantiacibacter aquimixticola]|uniref:Protein HflC n=1 Tax=Alteraurantiacibacter aquimixticola TaxID=2489173 RepID=A0A4T3F020_9SPHN|nr:protease modulator HflC [Alteraurantiacibacter aquimixticola]TIX49522.1 protease modulator HflC [Alteraurantiacibacter aquimixticola]